MAFDDVMRLAVKAKPERPEKRQRPSKRQAAKSKA
jgi:hypothetical protein